MRLTNIKMTGSGILRQAQGQDKKHTAFLSQLGGSWTEASRTERGSGIIPKRQRALVNQVSLAKTIIRKTQVGDELVTEYIPY